MKSLIKIIKTFFHPINSFSSEAYWSGRYMEGGNSGPGSYGHMSAFKAKVLNDFVKKHEIRSVIEFGCGDGNQLTLANYPRYSGYDISPVAITTCQGLFKHDTSKEFFLAQNYDNRKADLTISLDVIFHLTEDEVFERYMERLFAASTEYVIVYSSNQSAPIKPVSTHVRHRHFTKWVARNIRPAWSLTEMIPNAYPYNGDCRSTSFSDFFIFTK